MKTPDLIETLSSDCNPVKPVRITGKQFFVALFLSLLWMLLGVAVLASVSPALRQSLFQVSGLFSILEWVLFLFLGLWAFFLARGSIFPGSDRPVLRWVLFGIVVLAIAALSTLSYWQWTQGVRDPHAASFGCTGLIVLFALVPAVLLFRFLRRSVCLSFKNSISISFLAVAFLAGSGAAFVCPDDHASHMLISHILPVALGLILAVIVGGILDRRNRNEFERYFDRVTDSS
ncbi:MAG: NrsF family protein [Leptospiraceae bacterium]